MDERRLRLSRNMKLQSAVNVTSALNIAVFNVGIAIGSFVGGLVVDSIGLIHTPWIGAIMVAGAVVLTVWLRSLEKEA